jgi:hypothetical protein
MMKSLDEIKKVNAKFWTKKAVCRVKQIERLDKLADDARTHELAKFCKELDNLGSITAASSRLKQRDFASRDRKKKDNPIIKFIRQRLTRNHNASSREIEEALLVESETGALDGSIELKGDRFVVLDDGGSVKFHLARNSLPRTVFKLRKNIFGR